MIRPGPEDPSLLTLQTKHISEAIWQGHDERTLKFRRWGKENDGRPPARIVHYLKAAGFYGVSRLPHTNFESSLVSALVERWRPETHTFHLPQGECTITLEDVALQLGLPCEGIPVVARTDLDWRICCRQWLGVEPPTEHMKGQRVSLLWLQENFSDLAEDASDEVVQQFARAYILRLIGGFLMVDHSSRYVYLMYLPLLADLEYARNFSWGSAVLAHLYRELCNATNPTQKEIAGCLTLVHFWAWDHFPWMAPQQMPYEDPHTDEYDTPPPLGIRWARMSRSIRPPVIVKKQYRMKFDLMTEDEIVWRPYESLQIAPYYNNFSIIWRAHVPLLCFHILEWHQPDRVLRQFGYDQPIPQAPVDLEHAHTTKLTGKTDINWLEKYDIYILQWNNWQHRVSIVNGMARPLRRNSEYMRWYSRHTRRWIDPDSATSGHVANEAVAARELIRGHEDQELDQRMDRHCISTLQSIGEVIETLDMEQQMAPQSQQFDVPRMPQGGSRRGTRGYHAARDPILPAEGFYMGSMPQQHGFQGDAGNVGGNFGASSSSVPMAGGFGVSSARTPLNTAFIDSARFASATDDMIARWRSEIRQTPILVLITWVRRCRKKKRHAPPVSPSTTANARGKHFLFPSCDVAISNVPVYFPYKNVPSICTMGFTCSKP
ncbi:serine/threonine-protein phosphatase 7 long form-like protein [Senna tora]|uniref:Serine/threonine-protein phosphatase 7 long form-like protein n=1 Tax=Senna tora TaxID=362788 RepID=A0A834U138_9FABA|nr:serine/threonine-protein phosphatase 7 long form-like protein [Senna tora]